MSARKTLPNGLGLVSAILNEDGFRPSEPASLRETGMPETLVDSLICKYLLTIGMESGRGIADALCLPHAVMEERYQRLRARQIICHRGAAALNDYLYALSDQGREHAQLMMEGCGYVGPAPVPLNDYITSVDAQTITAERPKRAELERAFRDISIDSALFARLGPAVNSGAGLFLYGAPGNGKTTLAERITLCFGHSIWIPQAIIAEGEIIKLFDPAYHALVATNQRGLLRQDSHDKRWVKIRRPTVIVGGELTMDSLEVRHNPHTKFSEAPLQLKSNGGSLLIDDFGRQRMNPLELLNRWIVPLEKRYDYLALASGKKIQVPFDQLIIFSTNLKPEDLVDEAFLRRIPYKINVADPDDNEMQELFRMLAPTMECEYNPDAVDHLLDKHYRAAGRPKRRCHPRDLLQQIQHYCSYNSLPVGMTAEYFDIVVENYFTVVA